MILKGSLWHHTTSATHNYKRSRAICVLIDNILRAHGASKFMMMLVLLLTNHQQERRYDDVMHELVGQTGDPPCGGIWICMGDDNNAILDCGNYGDETIQEATQGRVCVNLMMTNNAN